MSETEVSAEPRYPKALGEDSSSPLPTPGAPGTPCHAWACDHITPVSVSVFPWSSLHTSLRPNFPLLPSVKNQSLDLEPFNPV